MTLEAINQTGAGSEREELIGELFHELSQPLTTLTCCLEVCLQKSRRSRRRDLRIALAQAQTITRLTAQLRQLLDTGRPCHSQEPAQPLACASRCCG